MIELKHSRELQSITPVGFKIVAVIPCYNTQKFIGDIVSRTSEYVDEVVVIDDGSTDMTREVAAKAGAKVISHCKNKGYGEAIKSCIAAARAEEADILITIDGDGQHNADDIPLLMKPILDRKAEFIIGSRFLDKTMHIPAYRKFGISVINFLWNFGSSKKVSDTQSGFRAYSMNIFEKLDFSEKGMSISIEILEKVRRQGIKIQEVPISCSYKDNNSTLSLKAIWHGLSVGLSVLKLRLKK